MADGRGLTVIGVVELQPVASVYRMLGIPAATPVTTPVAGFTVAKEVLLLLHVPPPVASVSVSDEPAHTLVPPMMDTGEGFTDMVVVVWQPVGKVYTMLARPGETPDISPVPRPAMATEVLLLVHDPPEGVELSVDGNAVHILVDPVIAVGNGLNCNC
jgi:hypothetical protein